MHVRKGCLELSEKISFEKDLPPGFVAFVPFSCLAAFSSLSCATTPAASGVWKHKKQKIRSAQKHGPSPSPERLSRGTLKERDLKG